MNMTGPTGAASQVQVVGQAYHADKILFNPSPTLLEIGASAGDPGTCDARLTLTTGVPVTTASVTAAGMIYFTPYIGNKVSIYNGSAWENFNLTEISLALTLTDAKNYDVFVYDNAGTLTLELSAAWTNDTTRADAIVLQDGVYVKSAATTRRYLGTIRASGTDTTEDSVTKRFVWNYKQRVSRAMLKYDTNYTYTTAALRYCNNDANNALFFVRGLDEDMVHAVFAPGQWATSTIGTSFRIGLDSTTAPAGAGGLGGNLGLLANQQMYSVSQYAGYPGLGYHFLAMTEYGGTGLTVYIAVQSGGIAARVMA
jgi:hypothetical protein